MKLLIAFATLSLMTGCVVEDQHRNCARNERWDGHHCMVDRARDHDHDGDRDHDHDHDHDRDHHEGEGGVEVR